MTNDDEFATPRPTGQIPDGDTAIELPPPKPDPAFAATDDHVAGAPLGLGHQPTDDLDPGVDPEHIESSSQGVKVEQG